MLTNGESLKVGRHLVDEAILINRSIVLAHYPTTAVSTIT